MGCVSSNKEKVYTPKNSFKLSSSILDSQNLQKLVINSLRQKILIIQDKMPDIQLLIRGSKQGFSAAKFHQFTDQACHTLLLFRTTNNRIFGGYTPCPWKKDVMYNIQQDQKKQSFLFTITKQQNDKKQSIQIFNLNEQQCAIMNCQNQGPIFGTGHDLHITDECDKNQNWANMGKSYSCKYKFGSNKANSQLAGEIRFYVEDYEVWKFQI